jgi:WD40 repeat protein
VRVADGFDALVDDEGGGPLAGRVVDAITDRCRQGPLLLVLDDVDAGPPSALPVVEWLAEAAARLTLLLVLLVDRAATGPAAAVVRRLERTVAATTELPPMDDDVLREILRADGLDDDTASIVVGVADGLPGIARREAAAWMERAASDRLADAASSSLAATSAAEAAHDSVFDEVLALVAARARRDALTPATWAGRKPYRSLASYGPEDADLFVGRERLIAELAARVLDRRLVAVVGASGSGKTSIVCAGLDPLVRSGRLPGGGPWRSHVMVPGTDPVATLLAVERIDEAGPQLLVVDQFEEIATSGAADAFAGRLLDLVLDAALDVHVVVVVRADQYGTLARSRHLVELVDDAQVLVGPPTDDELRRIVTQPALRTGCAVEPELVELLVADVAGQDGTLPLASAALAEVWEGRRDDALTAAQYVSIGGLAAAVERLGERALAEAADDDAVRDVLLRLVDVTDDGQWVRRRIAIGDVPTSLTPAIDALVAARLVVRDSDVLDVVHEIVFRAWSRLTSWLDDARNDLVIDRDLRNAAHAWSTNGRPDDDVYRGGRLQAAADWLDRHPEAGRDVFDFVESGRIVASEEHHAVLDRLAAEIRSRRRLSRALVAAAALLVVALIGTTFAVLGQRSANDARRDALGSAAAERDARASAEASAQLAADREEEAAAQRRARQEERVVGSVDRAFANDPQVGTLLAIEASRRYRSPESRSALYSAVNRNAPEQPFVAGDRAVPVVFDGFATTSLNATKLDVSADGRIAAVAGFADDTQLQPTVLVIDVAARTELGRFGVHERVQTIDVADDGQLVLVAQDRGIDVIDVASMTKTTSSFSPPDDESGRHTLVSGAFLLSPGDRFAVTTYAGGPTTLWDRITDQLIDSSLPGSALGIAGPTTDGRLAVAQGATHDGVVEGPGIEYFDLATGADLGGTSLDVPMGTVLRNLATPGNFTFSDDMHYLAGSTRDTLVAWDLTTGALTPGTTGAATGLNAIAFDPRHPAVLAIGGADGQLRFYDVAKDENLQQPAAALDGPVVDLAFSRDGTVLIGVSESGLVGVWRSDRPQVGTLRLALPGDPARAALGPRSIVEDVDGPVVIDNRDPAASPRPLQPGTDALGQPVPYDKSELSRDGSIAIASMSGGEEIHTDLIDLDSGDGWRLEDGWWPLVVTDDGTHLVALDLQSSTLAAWDIATRTLIMSRSLADLDLVSAVRITTPTDDGSVLFVSESRIVHVRLPDLKVLSSVENPVRFAFSAKDVPGTDSALLSDADGIERVDLSSGEVLASLALPDGFVATPQVSDDGSIIVTFGITGSPTAIIDALTLHVMAGSLKELLPLGFVDPSNTASWALTSDGSALVTPRADGTAVVWDLDSTSWEATGCRQVGRNLTRDEWIEFIGPDEPYRPTCPEWPSA